VCRIRLRVPVPSLQKLITAIDNEFPILEFLYIGSHAKHNTCVALPLTFEAPQLRHLILRHLASPIRSPLLTTAIGLVTLALRWTYPYPHPNHFLQPLSLLPHLVTLEIGFRSPVPKRDIERCLLNAPMATYLTLPNLRLFTFWGASAYLEALLPQMRTPLLETLNVHFFNQLIVSLPRLLEFITITENLRFDDVTFVFFREGVSAMAFPNTRTGLTSFYIDVWCGHLDWQVSSMAQIFSVLGPLFSTVVKLTLDYTEHSLSSEWHNQANRTQWRELLGSFRNVETLCVHKDLFGEVSHTLQLDGDPPLEILPELKELVCPVGSCDDRAFASFIQDRSVAGRPINVIEDAFPVGRHNFEFDCSAGVVFGWGGLCHRRPRSHAIAARPQTRVVARPTVTTTAGASRPQLNSLFPAAHPGPDSQTIP